MEYVVAPERLERAKKIIADQVRFITLEQLQVFMESVEWDHKVEWVPIGQGNDSRPRFHLNDLELIMVAAAFVAIRESDCTIKSGDGGDQPADGEKWEGVRRGENVSDAALEEIPF